MHDIVIRGGTIIDGTGKAAFTGDVAIADGRLAAVGAPTGLWSRPAGSTRTPITTGRRCGIRYWRRRAGMA
jgi:N-acyl-D-amino-acid deacylase